LKAKLVQ